MRLQKLVFCRLLMDTFDNLVSYLETQFAVISITFTTDMTF